MHLARHRIILLGLGLLLLVTTACVQWLVPTSQLATNREGVWVCPSDTPLPWGKAGPIKDTSKECATNPDGTRSCHEVPTYYVEYEREYGGFPHPPRPTEQATTGTTFYLGQRVRVGSVYALVTVATTDLLFTQVMTDSQLHTVRVEWTNHGKTSIPIDYPRQLMVKSIREASGRVRADTWTVSTMALTATGTVTLPADIPPGESTVLVPIIAPAGRVESVDLELVALTGPSSGLVVGDYDPKNPFRVTGAPTISAATIDRILAAAGSPAAGWGQEMYNLGAQYGIDPVFALAFFRKESSFGAAPARWRDIHNIGNIICTSGWTGGCEAVHGPDGITRYFRIYPTWAEGMEDWFKLIADFYIPNGNDTVQTILYTYAPPADNNNTELYIAQVEEWVTDWRELEGNAPGGDAPPVGGGPLTVQRDARPVVFHWTNSNDLHCRHAGATTGSQAQPDTIPPPPVSATQSAPLYPTGSFGVNVYAALNARGGALRDVIIKPGETWSFNSTIGSPDGMQLAYVGGVYGGGWCDLASRYVQALRPILPPTAFAFTNHIASTGISLANVAPDDQVAIWSNGAFGSIDGTKDLLITNVQQAPIRIVAQETGGALIIVAWLED